MKKLIMLITLISTILMGCSIEGNSRLKLYDDKRKQVSDRDSYNYIHKKNDKTGELNKIEFEQFIGIDTIHKFKVENDEEFINIRYNIELQEGKLKLVVVERNKKVVKEVKMEDDKQYGDNFQLKLKNGDYLIKIVGKDAKGKFEFEIHNSNFEL